MDLSPFTGIGAFGPAYEAMLEQDTHAPDSVDRVLMSSMVRLSEETATHLYGSLTSLEMHYIKGSRAVLEGLLSSILGQNTEPEGKLAAIAEFTRSLGTHAPEDLGEMRFGGTEEEIIHRGSGWCTDVARAACVLCQIAGLPTRMVYLYDLSHAYCGHVIIEVFRGGRWGAVDSSTGIIYRTTAGHPASVWELMNDASLIDSHRKNPQAVYTTAEQFTSAGIANYFCWEHSRYDYTVTGLNAYCLSILEMGSKGWPGGLRWLHGEDGRGSVATRLPSGQAR